MLSALATAQCTADLYQLDGKYISCTYARQLHHWNDAVHGVLLKVSDISNEEAYDKAGSYLQFDLVIIHRLFKKPAEIAFPLRWLSHQWGEVLCVTSPSRLTSSSTGRLWT